MVLQHVHILNIVKTRMEIREKLISLFTKHRFVHVCSNLHQTTWFKSYPKSIKCRGKEKLFSNFHLVEHLFQLLKTKLFLVQNLNNSIISLNKCVTGLFFRPYCVREGFDVGFTWTLPSSSCVSSLTCAYASSSTLLSFWFSLKDEKRN